ncbi:hypothetical protein [Candidatus Albibeggiatoa sp. nov. NOAA]|uniref:GumC family protein n=1 Tax=Candidatus Albibeggiatoa sp. nov. NOAA TaxID=3162724 RepID=UPI0032F43C83|nr:hypothetical protein [Thiotrichaceae bacterium]
MASENSPAPAGSFNPVMSLLRYKWLSLASLLLVGVFGFFLLQQKTSVPSYAVHAKLLVSPKFVNNLTSDRSFNLHGNQYFLYVVQQEELIKRADTLQETLRQPEAAKYWLRPNESVESGAVRLRVSLSTKSKARKNPFITLTLRSPKPDGLAIVLNTLMKVYIKKSQQEYFYDSTGRIQRLLTRKEQLLADIEKKRVERSKIAEDLGVTTFNSTALNPYDQILIDSNKAFSRARRNRVEAEAQLKALDEKRGYKSQSNLDSMVDAELNTDSVLKSTKTNLMRKRSERLAEVFGMKPSHPERKRADKDVAAIDLYLEQLEQEYAKNIRRRIVRDHQAKVYQARQIEKALAEEVARQSELATQYSHRYNQALVITNEIERTEKQLTAIGDRIDFLALESEAPGFVRVDTEAKIPRVTQGSTSKKLIVLLLGLAFALSVGLPILLDALDRRVRSPSDIHRILGFPPLAWILDQQDKDTQQLSLDNLRRLALVLERDKKGHKTLCFALTSVKPGGGTSTLTLELARMLTQLGIKTLAVELNAFKPDPRFEGKQNQGLTNILTSGHMVLSQLQNLIVPATATLPDRLPVGSQHTDHLVTYGRLPEILGHLNEYYDLILIDSPPILLSADAELLGEVSGGVLLVIEANKVNPGELKRATYLLERLDPPVVAAVLNRVKPFTGGGYFTELLKEHTTRAKVKPNLLKRLLWG